MNTKSLIIIFLSLFVTESYAQEWLWNEKIGAGYDDVGTHVQFDGEGNVLIAGTYQLEVDLGDITLPMNGYNEIFLIKYTPEGEIIWAKHFGTDEFENYPTEYVSYLNVDQQNNIYMMVRNQTSDAIFGCESYPSFGSGGMLVKLNTDGECQWFKRVGTESSLDFFDIYNPLPIDEGDIITSGFGSSSFDLGGCEYEVTPDGIHHGFVARLDEAGNCIWQVVSESFLSSGLNVDAIVQSNMYLSGYAGDNTSIGSYILENDGGSFEYDPFIGKMDLQGNVQWIESLEIDPSCFQVTTRNQMAANGQTGIKIWQYAQEFVVNGETVEVLNPEHLNYAFVKFDTETGDLDYLFSASTGGNGGRAPWIITHNDSFFVFTGHVPNTIIPCFGYNSGETYGMSVVQLNQDGECNSYAYFTGDNGGSFYIHDADISPEGTLYITGDFSQYITLATSMSSSGYGDAFVAAMEYPISVNELSQPAMELKLVNPANTILEGWIETKAGSEQFELMIYDLSGKAVTNTVVKSKKFTLDIAGLSNGYYTVQVKGDGGVTHGEFVKQ